MRFMENKINNYSNQKTMAHLLKTKKRRNKAYKLYSRRQ